MTMPNETPVDQGADENVGTVEGQENTEVVNESTQDRAPWSEHLEKFPTSLRPIAEDIFKEWDGNVTKRFQDLHSTYDPYKPIIEAWEPEPIQQAIALAQALEADPKAFYEGLAKAYNLGGNGGEQGAANPVVAQTPETPAPEFDMDDPLQARLAQQEELLRAMADRLISEDEQRATAAQQAEQDALLESTMSDLKGKHGDFDEQYVYGLMAAGLEPEQAVLQFHSQAQAWAAKVNAPLANAPRVMGASGGLPSNRVDPASLNSRETKNLVAQYLSANGG